MSCLAQTLNICVTGCIKKKLFTQINKWYWYILSLFPHGPQKRSCIYPEFTWPQSARLTQWDDAVRWCSEMMQWDNIMDDTMKWSSEMTSWMIQWNDAVRWCSEMMQWGDAVRWHSEITQWDDAMRWHHGWRSEMTSWMTPWDNIVGSFTLPRAL